MNLWRVAPAVSLAVWSAPAFAQHQGHEPAPAPVAQSHERHDAPEGHDEACTPANLSGLLGPYPMGHDASGTDWQADISSHGGVHRSAGD